MKDFLLICSCHGQLKKTTEAFKLLYPGSPIPEVVKGRDKIAKLSHQYKNDHLRALSRLSGKYSYYVKISESGEILEEVDLVRGTRLR